MGRFVKIVLAMLLALTMGPSLAQQVDPLAPPVSTKRVEGDVTSRAVPRTPGAPGALSATDVDALLDGFVPYALASGDIAGAVVVVVRDGKVLTQRGFGYADVAKRRPVDPRRTLFRPGSISKLFTWTAVMQQVEEGRLDLDADVNRYLDFRIPPHAGRPITLRQIMKHTAGFEEQAKELITTNPAKARAYDALLKEYMPARIYAPGTTPAYYNYATSLAGYIVSRVSGMPFDDYLDRRVFGPIGMRMSTFRQPLPQPLRPFMAQGYKLGSGEPVGFEFVNPAPAGSLSATGEDMARFMVAHLNGGAGLMSPETARLMHGGATTRPIPALNGMELGFYESDVNGRTVISHAGDTVGFHSTLHLFLNDGVGLYASFNSTGRNGAVGNIRTQLFTAFADRYFPAPRSIRPIDARTARRHSEMLTGNWRNSRRLETSFMSIGGLLGQAKVGIAADGSPVLPIANGLNGQPRKWVEVAPFVWEDRDSHERLAAVAGPEGVTRFSINSIAPFMVFERVPWYQNSSWLLPWLYASLLALLLTAVAWPAAAVVRRRYGAKLALEGRPLRAYRATKVAALLILAVLIGWAALVSTMLGNIEQLSPANDPFVLTLQLLSTVVFVGGFAIMLWNLASVWRRGGGRRWPAKTWSIALVLAAGSVLWVAIVFHLIGWGARY